MVFVRLKNYNNLVKLKYKLLLAEAEYEDSGLLVAMK
jgi:hypothetical protein